MGPLRPDGFLQHRHRERGAEEVIDETKRVLYAVQRNLVRLTHQVLMVVVEDLPEEMQHHVVRVPQDWLHVLQHVANAVVTFLAAHPEPSQ